MRHPFPSNWPRNYVPDPASPFPAFQPKISLDWVVVKPLIIPWEVIRIKHLILVHIEPAIAPKVHAGVELGWVHEILIILEIVIHVLVLGPIITVARDISRIVRQPVNLIHKLLCDTILEIQLSHFVVAKNSEQTITAGLMLRPDPLEVQILRQLGLGPISFLINII
jgi:hypothetical protein